MTHARRPRRPRPRSFALAAMMLCCVMSTARAVQVQDVSRLKGAETSKLVGMGLVVGLNGTGDGGKFRPAMRPLASMIEHFVDPTVVADELKDARNVALVALSATLPAAGVREGDRVDVQVSSVGPAKSLKGGRLFMVPLTGPLRTSKPMAFAEGALTIEDNLNPTTGVIKGGAQLTTNVMAQYLDQFGRLTLVLNDPVATWPMAHNVASLINGILAPDGPNIARAIDAKNVVIQVPVYEREDPAAFITQILQAYIDPAQIGTGARVRINEKTGTIIITGDVQISPVIISQKGLTITTVVPRAEPTPEAPRVERENFAPVDPDKRGGAKLADLLSAFNQLKVEPEDRIAIIKEIHRIGKLHAQLIIE